MISSTREAGWEAPTKGHTMFGVILTRCPECDQLSYDPRTELCDETHVDESWTYTLPDEFQDLAA